jgi:hypothetical protein
MGSLKLAWQKRYGDAWEERWNAWRAKMSEAAEREKNPMYGRHDHVHGLKRYAKEKVGKTLEEVQGLELAHKFRKSRFQHAQGENSPAYGKIYVNGGKSVKGYYKGKFFRSLLEYSFMKHLESTGISLDVDVDYECFTIPFVFDNRQRTYRPDFYVKSQNTVYEVKSSYLLKRVAPLQEAKWFAAHEFFRQRGIQFVVVSERNFNKVDFDTAKRDVDVTWKEETFKYFKGTT